MVKHNLPSAVQLSCQNAALYPIPWMQYVAFWTWGITDRMDFHKGELGIFVFHHLPRNVMLDLVWSFSKKNCCTVQIWSTKNNMMVMGTCVNSYFWYHLTCAEYVETWGITDRMDFHKGESGIFLFHHLSRHVMLDLVWSFGKKVFCCTVQIWSTKQNMMVMGTCVHFYFWCHLTCAEYVETLA
jgi:hypothetical protein